jgi:3-mercaptopyruvate sulfurtransferase SseA
MTHDGGYAKPHALATTAWVTGHADDPDVVLAGVSEDPSLYEDWHLPGAVALHWPSAPATSRRDIGPLVRAARAAGLRHVRRADRATRIRERRSTIFRDSRPVFC